MSEATKKALKIDGADGRPVTFDGADGRPVTFIDGEWYQNPKAHARRLMANTLDADDRRVYACLELHSMAYRQEICIKSKAVTPRSKDVLLTRQHIEEETQLPGYRVRAALENLEANGLAARRSTAQDDGRLLKGQIEIHCFAVPRQPAAEDSEKKGARALPFPDWFPREQWEPLIQQFKRNKTRFISELPPDLAGPEFDALVDRVAELFEIQKKAAEAIEEILKPVVEKGTRAAPDAVRAPTEKGTRAPHAYKDERKEINLNKAPHPPSPSPRNPTPAAPPATDEEEDSHNQPTEPKKPKPRPPWSAEDAADYALTFGALAEQYPPHRFERSKAAPLWRRMSPADRKTALDALPAWLECPKWKQDGGQFVTFCNNWLSSEQYRDPPPEKAFRPRSRGDGAHLGLPSTEEANRIIAQAEENDRRDRAARRGNGAKRD